MNSKSALLAHTIVEIVFGILLIFRPNLFLMTSDQAIPTLVVAKIYGVLAFTLGIISYLIWKDFKYNEFHKKVMLTFTLFHIMVAFQLYAAFGQGTTNTMGGVAVHMILALLLGGFYMKDVNEW